MQDLGILAPIAASTDRFVATVTSLTDAQVQGGTRVPPWTRGHVITHVARAADSLCRLPTWARTGVETPQYASMDARAAEIEAGAGRRVADLVADALGTAARFEEAVRTLPPAAWHAEVRMRTGELRTPATLVSTRLRELEIHHADLDAGYGFRDIPADAARWIIDDIAEALARRPDTPPAPGGHRHRPRPRPGDRRPHGQRAPGRPPRLAQRPLPRHGPDRRRGRRGAPGALLDPNGAGCGRKRPADAPASGPGALSIRPPRAPGPGRAAGRRRRRNRRRLRRRPSP
ncbi:maleylpyruvate isomerase family mycothiol-dependent enzyme [Streptomyces sp. NPDC006134]|uniref:maleylpyruvate isomerase family mycothiol-dependent enzyme n=1 Tax=Streptomyces sp. NPDC006134 TaxID=3154467 RepID=UPI0033F347A6